MSENQVRISDVEKWLKKLQGRYWDEMERAVDRGDLSKASKALACAAGVKKSIVEITERAKQERQYELQFEARKRRNGKGRRRG